MQFPSFDHWKKLFVLFFLFYFPLHKSLMPTWLILYNKTVLLRDRLHPPPHLQKFPKFLSNFLSNIFVHIWEVPLGAPPPPVQGGMPGVPPHSGGTPEAPPSSGGYPSGHPPSSRFGGLTLTQTLTWGPLDLDPDPDLGAPYLDLGASRPWPRPWPGGPPCEQTNWKHYLPVILRTRAVITKNSIITAVLSHCVKGALLLFGLEKIYDNTCPENHRSRNGRSLRCNITTRFLVKIQLGNI